MPYHDTGSTTFALQLPKRMSIKICMCIVKKHFRIYIYIYIYIYTYHSPNTHSDIWKKKSHKTVIKIKESSFKFKGKHIN